MRLLWCCSDEADRLQQAVTFYALAIYSTEMLAMQRVTDWLQWLALEQGSLDYGGTYVAYMILLSICAHL